MNSTKRLLTLALSLFTILGFSQKTGYVDTKYILEQLPQYKESEQRLNTEVEKWKTELGKRQDSLSTLKSNLDNDKVLLTNAQIRSRQTKIDSLSANITKFIDTKFGTKGESITLRTNLVRSIQDQIWNSINKIANKDKYHIILDKSSSLIMIYTDPRYDITDKVLKEMGAGSSETDKKRKRNDASAPEYSSSSTKDKTNNSSKNTNKKKPTKKPVTDVEDIEDANILVDSEKDVTLEKSNEGEIKKTPQEPKKEQPKKPKKKKEVLSDLDRERLKDLVLPGQIKKQKK